MAVKKRRSVKLKKAKAVKRFRVKKVAAKKAAVKKTPSKKKEGLQLEKVGEVTHYFPHVKAGAVLVLKDGLKLGDSVYIKGHTTNFKQRVASMQLDHVPIEDAKKGQEIGLLVKSRVRIGDVVYRV